MMVDPTTRQAAVVDDGGVLLHLGNPLGEQRALVSARAAVPRADRAVIAVGGEDRLTWLDSLSSQALTSRRPGESTELLILDPHGHVEHAAAFVDDGETAWLITDAADAEGLLDWLLKMRFRLRVTPRLVDDVVVIAGRASAVASLVPSAVVWHDPWPGVEAGGWGYADAAGHAGIDWDWSEAIVPGVEAEALIAGDQPLAGVLAADALRIAAWRPRVSDLDDRALPHELDWLRTAVHLSKGCYRGQETVAKVHNLGHPPRRVALLSLDGSDAVLPAPGAAVRVRGAEDGDPVGTVIASARHHEDGPIALAILRRNVPVDAELVVGEAGEFVAAAQEVIVPPDAGATASVPRLPRLGRRATS